VVWEGWRREASPYPDQSPLESASARTGRVGLRRSAAIQGRAGDPAAVKSAGREPGCLVGRPGRGGASGIAEVEDDVAARGKPGGGIEGVSSEGRR
jgi:hypothetical protein